MKVIKKLLWVAALIVFIALIAYGIVYRFRFPELTETQLFLKLWWVSLAAIPLAVGIVWGIDEIF